MAKIARHVVNGDCIPDLASSRDQVVDVSYVSSVLTTVGDHNVESRLSKLDDELASMELQPSYTHAQKEAKGDLESTDDEEAMFVRPAKRIRNGKTRTNTTSNGKARASERTTISDDSDSDRAYKKPSKKRGQGGGRPKKTEKAKKAPKNVSKMKKNKKVPSRKYPS